MCCLCLFHIFISFLWFEWNKKEVSSWKKNKMEYSRTFYFILFVKNDSNRIKKKIYNNRKMLLFLVNFTKNWICVIKKIFFEKIAPINSLKNEKILGEITVKFWVEWSDPKFFSLIGKLKSNMITQKVRKVKLRFIYIRYQK